MKYSWILFDADGTLFDFERAEAEALQATFQDLSEPFLQEYTGVYHTCNAQVWAEFEEGRISAEELRAERFRRMFKLINIERNPQEFSLAYLPNLARGTYLVDGAEELVSALRPNFRLGLVTNGLQDVQRPRLKGSKLANAFDIVVISEEVRAAKPDAAFFDAAFTRMGRPEKASVLIVGDGMTSDILGGLGYGLDTCWYNPAGPRVDPRFTPNYEIRALPELLKIVQ
jgi:2-haloacid dehalogenase